MATYIWETIKDVVIAVMEWLLDPSVFLGESPGEICTDLNCAWCGNRLKSGSNRCAGCGAFV